MLRCLLALLALCFGTASVRAADAQGYRFSPVNQHSVPVTASLWNPILDYVSRKSGVPLSLKIGRTSADTTSYVLAQEVDFAFTNHLFSPEREKLGWRVFARRDDPLVHGVIAVPADSPVKQLADLAGKEVAFPGPEAFIAYKNPYAQLLQRKIAVKVVFAGNTDGSLVQLDSGKVAAVGANQQLLDGWARREGRQYRILWTSDPYPDLALMVSPRVVPKDAAAVAAAFIGMSENPEGQAVLKAAAEAAKLPPFRFVSATGAEYEPYRRFYRDAPAELR
ncbi:phosphate/phosphite/phosphonate ABC transporter substrate-binding protein [Niveibacterium umoris]|uniref:Phosphonate transport system substrate-binding protein n=1 Tax=Niveibacterium umoris TaxID=1193620 RepID=A0A840BTZ1_9RHOO|nr:PhnD/SsuA/transferrin family substrate-binding protein [Niveibacterium umoris]MBB4013827.1 phosphonate transport system substrate-binding protein [Niveibacterium umoris]